MANGLDKYTFGVELEVVNLDEAGAYHALRLAGVPVAHPDSCPKKTEWRIHEDCSLSCGHLGSAEVVSPVLRGAEGLRQVRKVCNALQKFGATVNKSCGLHVHVGAEGLSFSQISNIYFRYAQHETTIDRFVSPERRLNKNRYSRSIRNSADKGQIVRHLRDCIANTRQERDLQTFRTLLLAVDKASTFQQAFNSLPDKSKENFLSSRSRNDRCYKVNLEALDHHGTIEFRHHQGSIDPTVVSNWIRFIVNFVNTSVRHSKVELDPLVGLSTVSKNHFTKQAKLRYSRAA